MAIESRETSTNNFFNHIDGVDLNTITSGEIILQTSTTYIKSFELGHMRRF